MCLLIIFLDIDHREKFKDEDVLKIQLLLQKQQPRRSAVIFPINHKSQLGILSELL